jgi:Tfp pilus assembly protein PilX
MNLSKQVERGQALVLIVLAIVGLIGLTAFAIDGGNTFMNRRHAQASADAAALAAALAKINNQDWSSKGLARASSNGYTNDGVHSTVTVNFPPSATDCNPGDAANPYVGNNEYIQVIIHSTMNTYFAPIIGINQTSSCVEAIAHAKPGSYPPLFDGAAVVGLDPNGTGYDSGQSNAAHWTISGGGIFSNSNAHAKNSGSVTFPDGNCVATVGTASGFGCSPIVQDSSLKYNYPADIIPLLPPIPACTGTAYTGADGKIHEQAGYENKGSVVSGWDHDYAPGVYCITNIDGNIHGAVTGTGVTFYIIDTSFTVKFNGGGYVGATAPTTGPYAGVLLFSNITPSPCTQNLEFRGNGSALNYGTIFLPSACIDLRGNSDGNLQRTQVIGYDVTSNGNAEVAVSFNPDENYRAPQPPQIELVR